LSNAVGDVGESADKYGAALAQVSDSLGVGGETSNVKAIVGSNTAETRVMQERNVTLQAELSESTSEIDALRELLKTSQTRGGNRRSDRDSQPQAFRRGVR